MKITSYGHSCLLVEAEGTRVLVDPGVYSTGYEDLTQLNALLITHNHTDHCASERISELIRLNPDVVVYTNQDGQSTLAEVGISAVVPRHSEVVQVGDMAVKVYHVHHETIYETIDVPQNTGFLIAERLYITGDNVSSIPDEPVEILALPVVAPWGKLSEYLDFARAVNPRMVIPVHDAIGIPGFFVKHPSTILPEFGIEVVVPQHGKEMDL